MGVDLTAKPGPRAAFRPWELHLTCCKCGHPLDDNQRMKDALATNNAASWAKMNLRILAEMAEDRGLPAWYVDEVRRIGNKILLMPSPMVSGGESPVRSVDDPA